MEEGESAPILSRKELRKQKLMEYLAAKGKLKPPNPQPNLLADGQNKKPALKVLTGKENNAPADRFKYKGTKGQTLITQSRPDPVRKTFGITNYGNIIDSALTGQNRQITTRPFLSSGPAKPKLNLNPVLTKTYTVVSSKSDLNAASHPRKQPNAGIQTSGKGLSTAAHTVGVRSNRKFSCSSNAVKPGPVKTVSDRMSLGPVIKTKTGLMPAVTMPRNTLSKLTHTSATATYTAATTTVVTKKVRSSRVSSVSVSQKSAVGASVTGRAGDQVQSNNRANAKPLLCKRSQPSCKTQLTSGLKSTSSSSKSTEALSKPEVRITTNKSAGQPAARFSKPKPGTEGDRKGQICKGSSQTSLRPASKCSSRPASGVRRPVVTELERKTKFNSKKENTSAKVPPLQAGGKRAGGPVMSHTAPQPARTISLTGQATDRKKGLVRVVPQTEGKKPTAAQEERLRKLKEWRETKGITYKRPPMPVKPQVRRTVSMPQPYWASMKEEDEAHSLISAVDRSLADCIKLLGEGCPSEQVKEVLSRLPAVSQKFAKYWICQARLMERDGDLDVLPMFEEAVRVVLEPVDELRTVVFDILKKKDEIQENENDDDHTAESSPEWAANPMMTPKPIRALICGERGDSSVVKYKITVTPGGPPSQQREPAKVNGQEVRFFTPVRRSVRIESASLRYPASLQDHDLCVTSFKDLISEEEDRTRSEEQKAVETSPSVNDTPMYIYRENEALKDKVSVQLVCEDEVLA